MAVTMEQVEKILCQMKEEYLSNTRPWIVGFSSGKDSTCVLQLTYEMLKRLAPKDRQKTVYVLTTNTMVESPTIANRLKKLCETIQLSADKDKLPMEVRLLRPAITETFWVNVIGRGYPCPNKWFRWCTDRLKIKPMNEFILNNVKRNGEVEIILGTRKSESANRAQSMEKHKIENSKLRTHGSINGAFVYAPIEDLEESEVWDYLMHNVSGWGDDNSELFRLYKGENVEVNVIMDKNAPPTGHSRFGCWTCTVVDKDKALQCLIDEGHEEYIPLLEFRDKLKRIRDDPEWRESYRKNQRMEWFYESYYNLEKRPAVKKDSLGPFKLEKRHELLIDLLKIQSDLRKVMPEAELITPEEIDAIELAWVYEGDDISSIQNIISNLNNSDSEIDRIIDRLLLVENDMSSLSRKTGIYEKLEEVVKQYSMNKMVEDKQ